ncbi:uncharacterized protein LOC141680048 [Apium graveolens]|uniref:uncharacterized protein LOC141680048 n=1 Tax=Apium graveolens TaxID=4045 RepID=UPI003D7AF297
MKDNRPTIQECKVYGKRHPGKCNKLNVTCFKYNHKGHHLLECTSVARKPKMTCFKCGKVGHMARNCKESIQKANVLRIAGPPPPPTKLVQPSARTFNMTMNDAVQDTDVVAGILTINSLEVKVLMDSGATRSFISENGVDSLKCVPYPLESSLLIEVANQGRVTTNNICPNCDVVMEGRNFSADLVPFKLEKFDIILGMNWLENHDGQIECRSKKVKLRSKDGTEVIFEGKKQIGNF